MGRPLHLARAPGAKVPHSSTSLQRRNSSARRNPLTNAVGFLPTYQFTPQASKNNAFCWADGSPSIFRGNRWFEPNGNGETVDQYAARGGRKYVETSRAKRTPA